MKENIVVYVDFTPCKVSTVWIGETVKVTETKTGGLFHLKIAEWLPRKSLSCFLAITNLLKEIRKVSNKQTNSQLLLFSPVVENEVNN